MFLQNSQYMKGLKKMHYQYLLKREKDNLVIKESAKRVDGQMAQTGIQEISDEIIRAAVKEGEAAVINAIRGVQMYPPGIIAEKMAQLTMEIYGKAEPEKLEGIVEELDLKTVDPPEDDEEIDENEDGGGELEDEILDTDEILEPDNEADLNIDKQKDKDDDAKTE